MSDAGTRREEALTGLSADWDVVVVGGGITGAGVFRQACARGLRCLLLEQRDFAWGTSSRSGKMVHGGLRYIAQGQISTSYHSVKERERLLKRYPGLVDPMEFVFVTPPGGLPMRWGVRLVLALYDWMAGRPSRRYHPPEDFAGLAPGLRRASRGGFSFLDGTTDDARLVLRVLDEGRALGGVALNYIQVTDLVRDGAGQVRGVALRDVIAGRDAEVGARVVINSTGAWADELRGKLGRRPRLRKLRGSHLVLPRDRLPVDRAIGITSPRDRRKMYILPWQGVTLVGTTDIDHDGSLDEEPSITPDEGVYLLEAANDWFPEAELTAADVIATQAGVRPVVGTGKKDPSKESRDEVVWTDRGMVTISGGKLTTFPLMARRALDAASRWLDAARASRPRVSPDARVPAADPSWDQTMMRLAGRFGADASQVLAAVVEAGEPELVEGTEIFWGELLWAARREQVVHLDDLLLRRTRLGLLRRDGGEALLDRIRSLVAVELGWDDDRWHEERARYLKLRRRCYGASMLSAD